MAKVYKIVPPTAFRKFGVKLRGANDLISEHETKQEA